MIWGRLGWNYSQDKIWLIKKSFIHVDFIGGWTAVVSGSLSWIFFKEGIKVSKFYRADNTLLYWYCDIVNYEYDENLNRLTVVDLLADVLIYPDDTVKVVDLDEMADALEQDVISAELLQTGLRRLNGLLTKIYEGGFYEMQAVLEQYEKSCWG